ncbi:MAG: hypothetical protein J6O09_03040 [Lachnospiraceae bacterium]|nr:hypothetical protein [Lachnospiraceae bacterium]
MSKITIFPRYKKDEDNHTNSFMFLLQNFYKFYQNEFYKFILDTNDDNDIKEIASFYQQEKGTGSRPDGEFRQKAIHVIVETKNTNWFYDSQIESHMTKFDKNEEKIFITLVSSYSKGTIEKITKEIEKINEKEKVDIKYLPLTFDGALKKIRELIEYKPIKNLFFDEILEDFEDYIADERLHEKNTIWLKTFPSRETFDEDFESGIIYRDGKRTCDSIDYIGGYKNKAVCSIGKLIDVVYREVDDSKMVRYTHVFNDVDKREIIEMNIEKAIRFSKYGKETFDNTTHTFYITAGFEKCNFVKSTKRGAQNARWFNLNDVLGMNKEEIETKSIKDIADLISEKEWG